MARQKTRRYKIDYARLYDNPNGLFDGVDVVLYPNGQPAIWLRDNRGAEYSQTDFGQPVGAYRPKNLGVEIIARRGPMGLGLEIRSFVGAPGLTVGGNETGNTAPFGPDVELSHIEICQYDNNPTARAYRQAYIGRNLNTFYSTLAAQSPIYPKPLNVGGHK
jgi:hypothetical protein